MSGWKNGSSNSMNRNPKSLTSDVELNIEDVLALLLPSDQEGSCQGCRTAVEWGLVWGVSRIRAAAIIRRLLDLGYFQVRHKTIQRIDGRRLPLPCYEPTEQILSILNSSDLPDHRGRKRGNRNPETDLHNGQARRLPGRPAQPG
jgi:hypothetical protein